MLAAASDGNVASQRFPGGSVRMHPSKVPGQVYIIVRFDLPASIPSILLLESADGEIFKRPLPKADATGEMLMILDESVERDQSFLRLLSNPTTTGSFLP